MQEDWINKTKLEPTILRWLIIFNHPKTPIKLVKRKEALPDCIHAFRIASLFFFRPNVVMIPITAKNLFLERVPSFSKCSFETKPSCLAAARSISRADNFFCCSLECHALSNRLAIQSHKKLINVQKCKSKKVTCRL